MMAIKRNGQRGAERASRLISWRQRPVGRAIGVYVLSLFLLVPCLRAEEGGISTYAPGSFSSFVDALPSKPGFVLFSYFTYYDGTAGAARALPIAGEIALDVGATSYTETLGGFYITPLKILGGYYVVGLAVPLVWTTVGAQVMGAAGGTIGRTESANGVGDLEFWPFGISWGALGDDLHVSLLGGIYAPTGGYSKSRLANEGLNHWTFEPGLLASYLNQKNGFELTGYLAYDFVTSNKATDYRSGQVVHVDATVAWHPLKVGPGVFGAGATGFYLQQTTGDSGAGAQLGGFREMMAGVGPNVSFAARLSVLGVAASVMWLPQLVTRNTLDGNYIWAKLGVSF